MVNKHHLRFQEFESHKALADPPCIATADLQDNLEWKMIFNYHIREVFTGTLNVKVEDEGEKLPVVGWQQGLWSFV